MYFLHLEKLMKEVKVFNNRPLSYEMQTLNFHLSWVATAEITSSWYSDILSWNFNRCYCVKSGHAFLHTPDGNIEMKAGNIYILPSGYPCGYVGDGDMYKIFSHFKMTRFEVQDVFSKIKHCIILENKTDFIDQMIETYKNYDICSAVKLYTMFYQIASEAIEISGISNKDFPEYSLTIKRALSIIEDSRKIDFSAEKLAEKMNMSVINLQRQFKKEVEIPLGQYIRERVMQAAAFELKSSTNSIGFISEKYGFSDQFYFAKAFKKHFGIQPSTYRKDNII